MADLGAYQAAAQQIYEPQKQAEATQLASVRDITKNSLEAQKGQVQTNYQDAINQLTQAVEDQTGQINQLYSQRLGGNFSGLQGNDMGKMFSRANQQTATIASTRANKLNEITTGQTNADIAYGAGYAALTPKYQSLETQYANEAYGSAVKSEQDQANKDREYQLSVAKYYSSAARGSQPTAAQSKQQAMGTIANALVNKAGKDGHVSQETWNAAMAQWIQAGYNAKDFVSSNLQFVNQRYKGYHGYN